MAKVRIAGRDTKRGALPMVCMVCGADAEIRLRKRFSWHPPWVIVLLLAGLLPYVIVALIPTKNMAVDVPMCRRHRNYWLFKFLIFFGSFLLMIAGWVGTGVLAWQLDEGRLVCFGITACILLWFAAVFLLQQFALRPVKITDDSITLANVSPQFIVAMDRERRARARERYDDEDDYEDYRPYSPRKRPSQTEERDQRDTFREKREPPAPQ